jgi:Zinc finger, C3HC4 type (RING finger)
LLLIYRWDWRDINNLASIFSGLKKRRQKFVRTQMRSRLVPMDEIVQFPPPIHAIEDITTDEEVNVEETSDENSDNDDIGQDESRDTPNEQEMEGDTPEYNDGVDGDNNENIEVDMREEEVNTTPDFVENHQDRSIEDTPAAEPVDERQHHLHLLDMVEAYDSAPINLQPQQDNMQQEVEHNNDGDVTEVALTEDEEYAVIGGDVNKPTQQLDRILEEWTGKDPLAEEEQHRMDVSDANHLAATEHQAQQHLRQQEVEEQLLVDELAERDRLDEMEVQMDVDMAAELDEQQRMREQDINRVRSILVHFQFPRDHKTHHDHCITMNLSISNKYFFPQMEMEAADADNNEGPIVMDIDSDDDIEIITVVPAQPNHTQRPMDAAFQVGNVTIQPLPAAPQAPTNAAAVQQRNQHQVPRRRFIPFIDLVELDKTWAGYEDCVLCMDAPPTMKVDACGHLVYCRGCVTRIHNEGRATLQMCPVCKQASFNAEGKLLMVPA